MAFLSAILAQHRKVKPSQQSERQNQLQLQGQYPACSLMQKSTQTRALNDSLSQKLDKTEHLPAAFPTIGMIIEPMNNSDRFHSLTVVSIASTISSDLKE